MVQVLRLLSSLAALLAAGVAHAETRTWELYSDRLPRPADEARPALLEDPALLERFVAEHLERRMADEHIPGAVFLAIGTVLGIVVVIGMFVGATVAMTAVNRMGTKRTVALMAIAAFPAFMPALYIATQESAGLVMIVLAMSIPTSVLALMYVVFVVARLSWTSKLQAGTDYSIQSAIFRGGATAAVGVGGLLAAWLGWVGFFVAYAAIVVAVSLVFFVVSDPLDRLVARRMKLEQSLARTGSPADAEL